MLIQEICYELEAAIAEALARVAADLRLVDIGDFIAYLRLEQYSCLTDIVQNAAELYFTPGYVEFAGEGEISAEWGQAPEVTLMLVINSMKATAYVALKLCEDHAEIKLDYVNFSVPFEHDSDRVNLLIEDITANMIGYRPIRRLHYRPEAPFV